MIDIPEQEYRFVPGGEPALTQAAFEARLRESEAEYLDNWLDHLRDPFRAELSVQLSSEMPRPATDEGNSPKGLTLLQAFMKGFNRR